MSDAKEFPPICVHILRHGRALCGLEGEPQDWPEGHRWIGFDAWLRRDVEPSERVPLCVRCFAAAKGQPPPVTLEELLRLPAEEGDTRPLCEVLPATPEFWESLRKASTEPWAFMGETAGAWSEHNAVWSREGAGVIVNAWEEPQIGGYAVHVSVRAHDTTKWDRSILVRGGIEEAKAAGDVLLQAWAALIARLEAIPGVIME